MVVISIFFNLKKLTGEEFLTEISHFCIGNSLSQKFLFLKFKAKYLKVFLATNQNFPKQSYLLQTNERRHIQNGPLTSKLRKTPQFILWTLPRPTIFYLRQERTDDKGNILNRGRGSLDASPPVTASEQNGIAAHWPKTTDVSVSLKRSFVFRAFIGPFVLLLLKHCTYVNTYIIYNY